MAQFFTSFSGAVPAYTFVSSGLNNASSTQLSSAKTKDGVLITSGSSDYNRNRIYADTSVGSNTDCEALVKFRIIRDFTQTIQWYGPTLYFRHTDAFHQLDFQNAYFCSVGNGTGSTGAGIYRIVGNSQALLANVAFVESRVRNKWYWMRAGVIGSTIRMRTWADGSSEPGTWSQVTDANIAGPGRAGFMLYGADQVVEVASLSFGTGADSAPSTAPTPTTYSGTSLDHYGDGYGTILLVDRITDQVVAKASAELVGGAYSISVQETGMFVPDYSVVSMHWCGSGDVAGDIRNDLIKRVSLG